MGQFDGIISDDLKTLFRDAIDALIRSDGLSLPCRLVYSGTKFTDCPNCVYNSITGKSNNTYTPGGPIPFYHGTCPYCAGLGRVAVEATDTPVYLLVIWDYKKWLPMAVPVESPEGMIQTICSKDLLPSIKKAKEIIVDTNIEKFVRHRFIREGEPNPAGFGSSDYIVTLWKRAA
jgi:hypothetical protein